MSSQEILNQTPNQIQINTDTSKIFVWQPRSEVGDYTNNSGGDLDLVAGTVMGRIGATNILIPLESDAADGSQFPVGILMHDISVLNTASAKLTFVVSGDVAEEKLVFVKVGDDLDTVISLRTMRDRIGADTVGIKLVSVDELTNFDNS
jgi:hypothetical protein